MTGCDHNYDEIIEMARCDKTSLEKQNIRKLELLNEYCLVQKRFTHRGS